MKKYGDGMLLQFYIPKAAAYNDMGPVKIVFETEVVFLLTLNCGRFFNKIDFYKTMFLRKRASPDVPELREKTG